MFGLIAKLLEVSLWYLTFFRPVVSGAQLCTQAHPRAAEVTNVTMALIFGWLMEAADRLFLASFIAMRGVYLVMRIVICLYLQHPKLLGANRVYELVFASVVDRYGPVVDSLVLQHMDRISEMGLVQYATSVGLGLVRALSGVVEMGEALLNSSTTTSVKPAPLPRRLSQERERSDGDQRTAPPRREPQVTVTYTDTASTSGSTEAKRSRPPPSPPPRFSPAPPRFEASSEERDDNRSDVTPFAVVQRSRTTGSSYSRYASSAYTETEL